LYYASRVNRDTMTEPTEAMFLFSLLDSLFEASRGALTFYLRLDSQGRPDESSIKTVKNPARFHLARVNSLSEMIDSPLTDHNNQVITHCYSGHVQMHMDLNEAQLADLTPLKRYLDSKSPSDQHRPGSAGRKRRDQQPPPQKKEEGERGGRSKAEHQPGSASRRRKDQQSPPQQKEEGERGDRKKDDRLKKRKNRAEPEPKKMKKTPAASAFTPSKSPLQLKYLKLLADHKNMMALYKQVKGPKQDTLPPKYQSKSNRLPSQPISPFSR
jgi:hypothetical protein